MLMDELPEETAGGRMLLDDVELDDDDDFLADPEADLTRRRKQGNQPRGNPPKH
jgi:hypothetical protein